MTPSCLESCARDRRQEPPSRARVRVGPSGAEPESAAAHCHWLPLLASRYALGADARWRGRQRGRCALGRPWQPGHCLALRARRRSAKAGALRARPLPPCLAASAASSLTARASQDSGELYAPGDCSGGTWATALRSRRRAARSSRIERASPTPSHTPQQPHGRKLGVRRRHPCQKRKRNHPGRRLLQTCRMRREHSRLRAAPSSL